MLTVTTDLEDYAPGSTATITASGVAPGATVMFEVDHVGGDTGGAGHEPWYVIDGGTGDLDGVANGVIRTTWYVNPDDSLGATFLLTARTAGADGKLGTADDVVTAASFTDSIVAATGVKVTLDESPGLQNGALPTTAPAEDKNDNDIANALAQSLLGTLATSFYTKALGFGTPINFALSGYTGAPGNTGGNAFTISPSMSASITDVRFVNSAGASLSGQDSGLRTLADAPILLYSETDNNIVTGRTGSASGPVVFAAYIEETGSPVTGGKIWTVQYSALKNDPDSNDPDDAVNLAGKLFVGVSENTQFSLDGAPSGQNLFLMFTQSNPGTYTDEFGVTRIIDPTIIATGHTPADQSTGASITTGDTINSSQAAGNTTFGTNNQMVTVSEGLRFTFVIGARADVTIPNLDQNEADVEANIDFTAMFGARSATFSVVQLQSGKSAVVKVTAYNTADESGVSFIDGYGNESIVPITMLKVTLADGVTTAPGVTITPSGGIDTVYTISGVKAGYKIEYATTEDHNRVLVENVGSGKGQASAAFDIGGFQLLQVGTARAEIGSQIVFEDDGPLAHLTPAPFAGTLTVDETDLLTDAILTVPATAFLPTPNSNYGKDGGTAVVSVYSLSLGVDEGTPSGLFDTATGSAVLLYAVSDGIEGRVGSDVVFKVSFSMITISGIDAVQLTLDQKLAVEHPTADPDEPVLLIANGAIVLTRTDTITDADGDTSMDSESIDITPKLIFKDDGPKIDVVASGAEPVLLTFDGDTPGGNFVGTQDAADSNPDPGIATVAFGPAFTTAAAGTDFGADGAGTTTWTYEFVINAADSGLNSGGVDVLLSFEGTNKQVVIGKAGTVEVLRLTLDDAGNVTLQQSQQVDHPTPGAGSLYTDQFLSLANNILGLKATATITDRDGDSAWDSYSLDLGGNVKFGDDGPSVQVGVSDADTIVLKTADGATPGGNFVPAGVTGTASAGFAGAFSAVAAAAATSLYGADDTAAAPRSTAWAYEFSIDVAGGDSGLNSGGVDVLLSYDGTNKQVVIGKAGTVEVLRLTVNNTGNVTLLQSQEIDHGTPGMASNYTDQFLALATTKVSLKATATVTDYDSDTATASGWLDLGGNLRFHDDGPAVRVNVSDADTIVLKTADGATPGGNFVPAGVTGTASAGFAGAFSAVAAAAATSLYGADDTAAAPRSTAWAYEFSIDVAGGDSGLNSGGVDVLLSYDGTNKQVVIGKAGTVEVLRLTVNNTGNVTLLQSQEIDHGTPGMASNYTDQFLALATTKVSLKATATVTDYDSDTATASGWLDLGGNLRFHDDGPAVRVNVSDADTIVLKTADGATPGGNFVPAGVSATATAGFAGAFGAVAAAAATSLYGADDTAAAPRSTAWAYEFSIDVAGGDSGLNSGGVDVLLSYDGTNKQVVIGKAGTVEVLRLTVNNTGNVTLLQSQEIDHGTPGMASNYTDQFLALATTKVSLKATATVTDYDSDTATASGWLDLGGNLRFHDDGPAVRVNVSDADTIVLKTADGATPGGNFVPAGVTGTASAGFAGAFSAVAAAAATSLYGADDTAAAPRSTAWAYEFSIDVAGGDSGLNSGGVDVLLSYDGTNKQVVIGKAGTVEVLRLTVNNTGNVTLLQSQEIDHGTPGMASNYTDQFLALATTKVSLKATATVTDYDSDTATASGWLDLGGNLRFHDDGPAVRVNVSDADTIVLKTADGATPGGNFVPAGVSATATAGFAGAFGAVAAAAANTLYGADDTAAAPRSTGWGYEFTIDAAGGDSGLKSGGVSVLLTYGASNQVVIGKAGAVEVLRLTVDNTGNVTLLQSQEIDHATPGVASNYTDQFLALANGKVSLKATATVTDYDSDTASASGSLDLGGNLRFHDDGPLIGTSPVQDTTPTLGTTQWIYSEAFAYSIGADTHAPTYAANDSDFANLSLSGLANGVAIGSPTVSWASETDSLATFSVSFTYDHDRNPATAQQSVSGQLVFDKNADTYALSIDALQVKVDVTLGAGTGYATYGIGDTTPKNGPSPVATGKLGDGFFIQITGFESPLRAGAPGDTAVEPGDMVTGTIAPVTLSSTALGVSGNTIQSGEAANLAFFTTDPKGNLGATNFAYATDFYIKFDGVETESDDLILVLNLVDASNSSITTTRAIYVDQGDIYEIDTVNTGLVGTKYQQIIATMDNNDGLLIVQSNDYNFGGTDNWVLKGLQILSNNAGLTSTAIINLNRAVGSSGGSSYAADPVSGLIGPGNTVQEDTSTNPLKIIDAGFSTTTTTPPTLDLQLFFNVVDADGDSTAAQTIDIEYGLPAPLVEPVGFNSFETVSLA